MGRARLDEAQGSNGETSYRGDLCSQLESLRAR